MITQPLEVAAPEAHAEEELLGGVPWDVMGLHPPLQPIVAVPHVVPDGGPHVEVLGDQAIVPVGQVQVDEPRLVAAHLLDQALEGKGRYLGERRGDVSSRRASARKAATPESRLSRTFTLMRSSSLCSRMKESTSNMLRPHEVCKARVPRRFMNCRMYWPLMGSTRILSRGGSALEGSSFRGLLLPPAAGRPAPGSVEGSAEPGVEVEEGPELGVEVPEPVAVDEVPEPVAVEEAPEPLAEAGGVEDAPEPPSP